jgi:hypothetical protein
VGVPVNLPFDGGINIAFNLEYNCLLGRPGCVEGAFAGMQIELAGCITRAPDAVAGSGETALGGYQRPTANFQAPVPLAGSSSTPYASWELDA